MLSVLTASCYTQMWLQEWYPWQGPQNAVFSWRSCSKASGGHVQIHLLHPLQSSGTPRCRAQAGSPTTGEHRGQLSCWAPTWKAAPHCHSMPQKPNLLTFQALPVWLNHSANIQWELEVGKGGRASQVGGWSIPCCATFLPPAPAAMALCSSLLTASCSVTAVVPKVDPGVLCRDKIHPKGSFLELSLWRKEEISEQMGLGVLPLAQECGGERKKKWSCHFPSPQTQFLKREFETSDKN